MTEEMNDLEMRDGKYLAGNRDKAIIKVSYISILANAALAAFKAVVGVISGSIAVTLDAVNNLSDALSSVITIVGTKLAGKPADKEHPYGYGRVEYLSATIIAAIVLYAGITALISSVKKIIQPTEADYSYVSLIIIASAVVVKLILGFFVEKKGREFESKSLVASGADAKNDAILSTSVLAAALIMKFTGFSIEAYIGVVISVIILKSGFEMLKDTLDDILGSRVSAELSTAVKKTVTQHKGVHGAYDLFLNAYGPNRMQGSIHVEVDENMTADEIDKLSMEITQDVYVNNHVVLTAVGIYSRNVGNSKVAKVRSKVRQILSQFDYILQMHGLYLDEEKSVLKFDIIISFDAPDREGEFLQILQKVKEEFPNYNVIINLDADVSD